MRLSDLQTGLAELKKHASFREPPQGAAYRRDRKAVW